MIDTLKYREATINRIDLVCVVLFTALVSFRTPAFENETAPLKIFTFPGAATERAMQAKDYGRVIADYRTFGASFGYHDLVNVCAAYVFEGEYRRAARACRSAEQSASNHGVLRPPHRADRWAAHANHAVAHALAGNFESAREHARAASKYGGDRSLLEHNTIAIEQRSASPVPVTATH